MLNAQKGMHKSHIEHWITNHTRRTLNQLYISTSVMQLNLSILKFLFTCIFAA